VEGADAILQASIAAPASLASDGAPRAEVTAALDAARSTWLAPDSLLISTKTGILLVSQNQRRRRRPETEKEKEKEIRTEKEKEKEKEKEIRTQKEKEKEKEIRTEKEKEKEKEIRTEKEKEKEKEIRTQKEKEKEKEKEIRTEKETLNGGLRWLSLRCPLRCAAGRQWPPVAIVCDNIV
jgi:outer membrane biosynthesis protein TonB